LSPTIPVLFRQSIFNSDDRVTGSPGSNAFDETFALKLFVSKAIELVRVKMRSRHVQCDGDVLPFFEAGPPERIDGILQHIANFRKGRGKAPFVGCQRTVSVALQADFGRALIDFPGHGQCLINRFRRKRSDKNVLNTDLFSGVLSSAEKIDDRPWHTGWLAVPISAKMLVERDSLLVG